MMHLEADFGSAHDSKFFRVFLNFDLRCSALSDSVKFTQNGYTSRYGGAANDPLASPD